MLDIEQHNRFSNAWRNIVFSSLLLVFLVGGVFIFQQNSQKSLAQEVTVIDVEDDGETREPVNFNQQGEGDVTVEPPEIIKPSLPELVAELPLPKDFTADRIIVKDVETGIVLYAKDAYKTWSLASMTKLMTAIVLQEKIQEINVDMSKEIAVTSQDVMGTHMYAGDMYSRQELWEAMLIGSSNKAAITLVQDIYSSQPKFVSRMNEKAVELGMTDTVFFEPTGLDGRNVSTPSDVVLLLAEALDNKNIKDALQKDELNLYSNERSKKHHLWNTNWLLLGWIPSNIEVVAGKTGFINLSQYNFTARFKSDNNRFVDVVIMGADLHEARFTEARDVALASIAAYDWPKQLTTSN